MWVLQEMVRTIKNYIRISPVLFLLGCLIIISGCSAEVTSYSFANYQDLRYQDKQGLIDQGWIPKAVPVTFSELHLQMDIDTNQRWMTFNTPVGAMNDVIASGKELSDLEKQDLDHYNPTLDVDWWKPDLKRLSVYRIDNDTTRTNYSTYLAVDGNHYFLWLS